MCSECIHDLFDSATSQTAKLEILQQQGAFGQLPGGLQSWHNACLARHAPHDRTSSERHGWLQSRLLGRYFMSRILYLPTSAKGRTQAPIQESEAQERGMCCSQTERIAHDLKNCMSVLLLAITSLKDNTDQRFISVSRRRVLENIVEEMNRLVDEMVVLAGRQMNK